MRENEEILLFLVGSSIIVAMFLYGYRLGLLF
jgi:hypothetical protein